MSNVLVRVLCLPPLVPTNSIVPFQNANFLDIQINVSIDTDEKEHQRLEPNFQFDKHESALFTQFNASNDVDNFGTLHVPREQYHLLWHAQAFIQQEVQFPMETIEQPLHKNVEDVVNEFNKNWLQQMDQIMLLEMIAFANKWGIKAMVDLTCAKLGNMVIGKSMQQVQALVLNCIFTPFLFRLFGIQDSLAVEERQIGQEAAMEEDQFGQENQCCDDS